MTLYHQDRDVTLHQGDVHEVLTGLPDQSVHCIVTSPPYYGLRDYGLPPSHWPAMEYEPMHGLPPVTVPAGTVCLGLEPDPWQYVGHMVLVARELRRVLRPDGTLWLNIGDSYSSSNGHTDPNGTSTLMGRRTGMMTGITGRRADVPRKNLLGMPWRLAFALMADGWIVRNDIDWYKPNAMPEPVKDRLACRHEDVFLMTRSPHYWFDLDPIRERLRYPELADGSRVFGGKNKTNGGGVDSTLRRRGGNAWTANPGTSTLTEPGMQMIAEGDHSATVAATSAPMASGGPGRSDPKGRNPGDVWSIPTQPFPGAHFATMPPALAARCILAGCPEGGVVLDPFAGSGTVAMVARRAGRRSIGIDAKAAFLDLAIDRIGHDTFELPTPAEPAEPPPAAAQLDLIEEATA